MDTRVDPPPNGADAVLEVEHLTVRTAGGSPIVDDVSFVVGDAEMIGLIGESGSGKTTLALALLGHAKRGAVIDGGAVRVNGTDVLALDVRERWRLRGSRIAYVPQDPPSALNPSMSVGALLNHQLRTHDWPGDRRKRAVEVLHSVQLPVDDAFLRRYPHQLSGGQQQRVAIGVALAARPEVLVLDEPTTGLDVLTQQQILIEIDRLRHALGVAVVYVSHDLNVVRSVADRLVVMYGGVLVEEGPTAIVMAEPAHPYTRGLLAAVPDGTTGRRLVAIPGAAVRPDARPQGCPFAPRCGLVTIECTTELPATRALGNARRVRCIATETSAASAGMPIVGSNAFVAARSEHAAPCVLGVERLEVEHRGQRGSVRAVDGVTFDVEEGEVLALVGGSGSGKSSLVRALAGLQQSVSGTLTLGGRPLSLSLADRSIDQLRQLQLVAQNPADSLNPRMRVGRIIGRSAECLRGLDRNAAERGVARLLELVRLPRSIVRERPSSLSGGEMQRVAIARALAAEPSVLLCDEITSALDVSVQAAIVELMREVQQQVGCAVIFVTHDLGLVASVASRVAVMDAGRIVELRSATDVFNDPHAPTTRALVSIGTSIRPTQSGEPAGSDDR